MACSVARTLGIVGDAWSMLVLRDIFRGQRRFDELQADLGIATNVLTGRLKRLVDAGVLEKRAYQDRPQRFEYHLTAMGRDLHPVIVALMQFGDTHLADASGPPRVLVHETCAHATTVAHVCAHCGEGVSAANARYVPAREVRSEVARLRRSGRSARLE